MAHYTFSTIGINGEKYYPASGKSGPGLLDFNWTTDITKAMTWPDPDLLDIIAIEFYNTEIIEIINIEPLEYKVIKGME